MNIKEITVPDLGNFAEVPVIDVLVKGGDVVPLTLVFEDAAKQRFTQEVKAPVTALGGGNAPMKHDMKPGMGHKH